MSGPVYIDQNRKIAKIVRNGVEILQCAIPLLKKPSPSHVVSPWMWECQGCNSKQMMSSDIWYPMELPCKGCLRVWRQYYPVRMRVKIGNGEPMYWAATPNRLTLLMDSE